MQIQVARARALQLRLLNTLKEWTEDAEEIFGGEVAAVSIFNALGYVGEEEHERSKKRGIHDVFRGIHLAHPREAGVQVRRKHLERVIRIAALKRAPNRTERSVERNAR